MNIFGFGGGTGGGGGGNQPPKDDDQGQQQQQQGQQQQNQNPGGEEEDVDDGTFLASLFADDDDSNGDGGDKNQSPGQQQNQNQNQNQNPDQNQDSPEQQVSREIQDMLKKMSVSEDMIPDGFDPSDPKQFRDVMAQIQQQAAVQTMQMVFKPMQLAIQNLTQEMKTEIQNAMKQHGTESNAQQILRQFVPEADDPEHSGLVKTLFTQAQKKSKNHGDAAKAVRRALDAMGIKGKQKGQSDSDPSSGGYRTGKDALDMFAPLPKK